MQPASIHDQSSIPSLIPAGDPEAAGGASRAGGIVVGYYYIPAGWMREEQHRFLQLLGQGPARLTAEQVAWVFNCQAYDIPLLVASRLLKPLGRPQPNSVKYFATVDVLAHARDPAWLSKATDTISRHWQEKNARKKERSPTAGPYLTADLFGASEPETGTDLTTAHERSRRGCTAADTFGPN